LTVLHAETPHPDFILADANELVRLECHRLSTNNRFRAVIFLDPFGMQVDWATLQAIQQSGRVDLWLLIPTGIGVARLLPRSGPPSATWETRLDRCLGTSEWRSALLEAKPDLLGHIAPRREVGLRKIVDFVMSRLRSLFGPGLHPTALELHIRHRPAYHLIFACSSRSARARQIAFDIAGYLLDRARKQS
jgi:three-Cys-motif partner protein